MKKIIVLLIPVLLIVLCTNTQELDENALKDYIAADSIIFNTSTHFEGGAVSDSGDTTAPPRDSITPVLWGREITSHPNPGIEVEISADSAYVVYTGHNVGNFHILHMLPDSTYQLLKKSLSETFEIRAIFKRTGNPDEQYRGWKLTNISGSIGNSDSIRTVNVDSVTIQSTYLDTIITDPTTIIDTSNLIIFKSLEEVTITIYTNTEDAKIYLHTFILAWPYHVRVPFTNNGDGSYTGTWNVQLIPSIRFAIFDMLKRETLHDEQYAYDFQGWFIPYIIIP